MALEIMALLDANSRGLHAVDMILLCTSMHQYYVQADGIPQYIIMMEDAQKKAKRAGIPIAGIELMMMALVAVLATQHYPCEVDDWEGHASSARTWAAWKIAFHLTHIKRQCQLQALGGGPLGGAGSVLPATDSSIDRLKSALNNLALAAKQHSRSAAADSCQPSPHGHSYRSNGHQQEIGGDSGKGQTIGTTHWSSKSSTCSKLAVPRQLLLDPWS
jgi:hypothetical protein